MFTETISGRLLPRQLRRDTGSALGSPSASGGLAPAAMVAVVALVFVLLAGGGLEPTDTEARLGLAAGEPLAPYGQVLGGYDPSLSPGQVAVSRLWTLLEGGIPSPAAIRWPAALAAVGIGLILARRMGAAFGPRAGVLTALTSMATLGMIDHSAVVGVDAVAGLALVATIDRLLSGRSDWLCGLFAAVALMLGGWPTLGLIVVSMVVLGRAAPAPGPALLVPPLVMLAAWSAWALSFARAEVWAAVLTFPLTQSPSWNLWRWALAAGLPWSPVGLVAYWPTVRSGWGEGGSRLVSSWLKVAGVGLAVGTVVPGFAAGGMVLVVCGLAVLSAAVLDALWAGTPHAGPRRTLTGMTLVVAAPVAVGAIYAGTYLAAAQPHFRAIALVMVGVGLATALLAVDAAWMGSPRGAARALIAAALVVKLAYSGYYLPEKNYRFGKGPWGRAIGQHVPPRWPIYMFHSESPALALATEHPVRQLRSEVFLKVQPGDGPKFVLLTDSEFAHWPEIAPKIQKVHEFEDEFGGIRVLARSEGRLNPREGD